MGQGGEVANVSFDAELGWTATVPAWDGITTLLNKTLTVIASDEWYDDTRQSIRTNINHVGYLQTETVQTNADERFGRISEARFTVEGFGHQLARQNISPGALYAAQQAPATGRMQWVSRFDAVSARRFTPESP